MSTLDPQVVHTLSVGVALAAMIMVGRSKGLLKARGAERCASCRRRLGPGRRCPSCT